MALERVCAALRASGCSERAGQWTCPNHDDREPSLSVREGEEGRVLIKCHADCPTKEVVGRLGLEMRDLFSAPPDQQPPVGDFRLVATHHYRDPQGRVVRSKKRWEGGGSKCTWESRGPKVDFLYRLRVRSNYDDAADFVFGVLTPDDARQYFWNLLIVTDMGQLLLESVLRQQIGKARFDALAGDFLVDPTRNRYSLLGKRLRAMQQTHP